MDHMSLTTPPLDRLRFGQAEAQSSATENGFRLAQAQPQNVYGGKRTSRRQYAEEIVGHRTDRRVVV